jgi:hypothetical protein
MILSPRFCLVFDIDFYLSRISIKELFGIFDVAVAIGDFASGGMYIVNREIL